MMVPVPVVILTGAVMLLLVWLLVRGGRARDLAAPPASLRPRIAVPARELPPGVEDEVRALMAQRQKIEAIKRVREATGLGLKDAKEMVEAIEAGGTPV